MTFTKCGNFLDITERNNGAIIAYTMPISIDREIKGTILKYGKEYYKRVSRRRELAHTFQVIFVLGIVLNIEIFSDWKYKTTTSFFTIKTHNYFSF